MAFADHALSGRTALVTGASRGIGKAIALKLGALGADVAVGYHVRSEDAERVADDIRRHGVRAVTVGGDLGDEQALAEIFRQVAAAFGRLDIFVANAAATAFKPLREVRTHHLDLSYALNWRAFVLGAVEASRLMESAGDGVVVAVSGFGSERCIPGYGVLGPLKAAMESSVRYLGAELAPLGIRVNGVNPGFLHTDSSRVYFERTHAAPPEHVVRMTPMGRATTAEDVADVVAFLCMPEARFICGQTIRVDGGLTLLGPPYPASMMPPDREAADAPATALAEPLAGSS
jgi:enoyl-[acyl-carrier protein] reductase III